MRLTERKTNYPKCDKQGNLTKVDYIAIKDKKLAEEKLCQLEDFEDELGIDLITLFKALFNGIYAKRYIGILFVEKPFLRTDDKYKPYSIDFYHSDFPHYLKDYGKTWALTKEELE